MILSFRSLLPAMLLATWFGSAGAWRAADATPSAPTKEAAIRTQDFYDKTGSRYGKGSGLRVLADGKEIGAATKLERLTVRIPKK